MMLVVNIIYSLVLMLIGYVAACCYLNNVKFNFKNALMFKPTKNKLLYLIVSICSFVLLIVVFETVYITDIITQLKSLTLVSILLPIAAIDFRLKIIPNKYLIVGLGIRLIIFIVEFIISVPSAVSVLKDSVLGAIVIGGFFLILLLIFKNSIGMGDIKLFAVMGLYQGLSGAMQSVFFCFVVSFFVSIGLLISRRKKRADTISFGPSICLGTIIAIGIAGV